METSIFINWKGVELECFGYYAKGSSGSWDTQPDEESFEINEVHYDGFDVTELLEAFDIDWTQLESKCLENLPLDDYDRNDDTDDEYTDDEI